MARFIRRHGARRGRSLAGLTFIGEAPLETSSILVVEYDGDRLTERSVTDLAEAMPPPEATHRTWINIYGLHDVELIRQAGRLFQIHPLILQDVIDTDQRPNFLDMGDWIFLLVKMLRFNKAGDAIISEQLGLVLGSNFLLTFQERQGDVFDPVRERLRKSQGRVRGAGADYLMYALLDAVVDNYILVVERLGERVEEVDEILEEAEDGVLEQIRNYKREMNYLRKTIRPSREAILQLAKADSDLVHDTTLPFLRDLEGLATRASEAIDTYRDMLTDQLGTYRAAVGMKLNEIMKLLTIYTALFIPLTFLVGIYGMNFDFMPELRFRQAYFIVLGVMAVITLVMLRFFRRKGWL
jgi:magnesium transporter